MNNRTLAAYKKWISFHDFTDNEKSVNDFHKEFIGIFKNYTEFFAHEYNLPGIFLVLGQEQFLVFIKSYYELSVFVQVESDESFNCHNAKTNEFSGYRMAFFRRL
jgi:hypothetical protein